MSEKPYSTFVEYVVYQVRDRVNRQIFNPQLKRLFSYISPKDILIFDVGCFFGESIERFSSLFPGSTIYSFEPDEATYVEVTKKYKHRNNISIHNVGIGASDGVANFYKCSIPGNSSFNNILESSEWAKHRARLQGKEPADLVRRVEGIPLRSLDSFAEEQGVKHIDVLKLDVEGWENECLKGCQNLLSLNKVSVIQLELITTKIREHTITIDEIKDLLASYDFDYFITKHRQIPFSSSPELFEVLIVNRQLENYKKSIIPRSFWL